MQSSAALLFAFAFIFVADVSGPCGGSSGYVPDDEYDVVADGSGVEEDASEDGSGAADAEGSAEATLGD